MLPCPVDRTTTLVSGGKTDALIVYPSGDEGRALAEAVQDAVRSATGVAVPLASEAEVVERVPAWPADAHRRRPLILIGSIDNNRALVPLYASLLCGADNQYPGDDGFTVRTAVDPYGTGVNSMVLGASTPAGMQRAVKTLAESVRTHGRQGELVLPGLLRVELGAEFAARAAEAQPSALNYGWTGNEALLRKTVETLRAAPYMKPDTVSYNPGHYGKEAVVRELIALIQTSALGTDEVTHIQNVLLGGLHEEYRGYWIVHKPDWLGTRHQTMGMMAFLVTADYLLNRARPNAEAAAFLRTCVEKGHAFFRQFETNYRDEGHDNGSFDSAGPIGRYMMAFGNTRFFENGTALRAARRAIMMTDNRGWFVAPGNYEDVRQGRMNCGVDTSHSVGLPAFVDKDAGLQWIITNAPGIRAMTGRGWAFSPGIAGCAYPLSTTAPGPEPTNWLGVSVLSMGEAYYELCGTYMTHRSPHRPTQPWEPLIPRDQAVEMVAFRDHFAPEAQYLFLNGYQGGRYNSMDANAISRYADRGHIWLISQTEQFGHYFRNAVHIAGGYRDDYLSMPGTIRLEAAASFDDVGMSATTLPAVNGADWTRSILWLRGRAFVVIDTVTSRESGHFDLTCTWRSLPVAALEDEVWVAKTMGSRFELHNADGVEQRSGLERARATEQLSVHPYVLRQHVSAQFEEGQRSSFRNLFFTAPAGEAGRYAVRPLGEHAVLISDQQRNVTLLGAMPLGLAADGPLTTDARLFVVGPQTVRLAPEGSVLRIAGSELGSGRTPAAIRRLLGTWWESVPAPTRPDEPVPRDAAPSLTAAWTFADFERPRQMIADVRVVDPAVEDAPDLLFDRQCLLWNSGYTWPEGTETVTYDLGRIEELAEIRLDGRYAVFRDPPHQPKAWRSRSTDPVTLAFSDDNFGDDVRTMSVPHDDVYRQIAPYIYKPYLYTPNRWKQIPAQGEQHLDVAARYVRTPASRCSEMTFYRKATRPPAFDGFLPVDVDGDGHDELAVATETGELVLLNGDGAIRWRRRLENSVTDLFALPAHGTADTAAAQRLLVADNGWTIRELDGTGECRLTIDCAAEGSHGAFALGAVLPDRDGPPLITVATGRGADCLALTGKRHCAITAGGVVCDVVLRGTSSAPRTRGRTATRNAWGGATWRDVKREPGAEGASGSLPCFWWLGLGFEFWPEIRDEGWRDGLAVFVARAGVNAYGLGDKEPKERWRLPANGPISCYTFANIDGKPGAELLLGRLDGFIHVVGREGTVCATWSTNAPVKSLATFRCGEAVVAAGTGDELRLYNAGGAVTRRHVLPTERVTVLRNGDTFTLVSLGNDGRVVAFRGAEGTK